MPVVNGLCWMWLLIFLLILHLLQSTVFINYHLIITPQRKWGSPKGRCTNISIQSDSCILYHWIELVNSFHVSVRLQIESVEALVDMASQIRPTVGESRIPSDNKTAAKSLREGGKQTIQIVFSAKSSYSIMHLPRASTSFSGSQQLHSASHFNLQPIHWCNIVTASTVESWRVCMSCW